MRHARRTSATEPFPGDAHGLTVHRYGRPLAPAGDAQAEREFGRFHLAAVDPYLETYLLVEGVLRPLGDRHPYAAGHFGRDVAGRVDHRGQPAVVGGIPQVLRELGPSLVHVRRAAGIARQQAVEDVRAVVALLEIAAVVGNHHLVDLLVVLAGVIGVRGLRGQGVERHALQMVGELHVARDFGHLLQRVHHLHGRAKLRTLRRGGAVQRLVAPVQPRRQADVAAYVLEAFLHGRHMRRVVAALVVDHRLLDPLREVHAVQREGRRDHLPAGEDARPVERLPVDQVAQLQQEFVARDVVKPVDDAQIVAAALFAPESPVPQRGLRKLAQLVTEIGAHQFDDALVAPSPSSIVAAP